MIGWFPEGVTHVAMESTGVNWKPIYNILLGKFEVMVVNAAHIKAVPGRKTDVLDAEWIADLLQHGLVAASFIPDQEQRDRRDLTRTRTTLVDERSRSVQRTPGSAARPATGVPRLSQLRAAGGAGAWRCWRRSRY